VINKLDFNAKDLTSNAIDFYFFKEAEINGIFILIENDTFVKSFQIRE